MRLRPYVRPSRATYSRRTARALIVMPFSRSRSIESRTWLVIWRGSMACVSSSRRSARVDFPWSMWAMIEKLRSRAWGIVTRRESRRASRAGVRCDLAGKVQDGDEAGAEIGQLRRTPGRHGAAKVRELPWKVVGQRPAARAVRGDQVVPRVELGAWRRDHATRAVEGAHLEGLQGREIVLEAEVRHDARPCPVRIARLRRRQCQRPWVIRIPVRPDRAVGEPVEVPVIADAPRDVRAVEA